MTATATFSLFRKLPTELRLIIWRLCLPRRVHELDQPSNGYALLSCNLFSTTHINGHPPVLTRVCRESRAVAFEAHNRFSEELPPEARWCSRARADGWLDSAQDSVHLNWTPEIYDYFRSGIPFANLAWIAARVRGGSFMFNYVRTTYRPAWSCPPIDLKQVSSWMVVMRVVIVHASPKAGAKTGLFGLLGDAPVQLVDVSDEARMNTYFDLAEACERKGHVHTSQDLRRESPDLIRTKLTGTLDETYPTEKSLPAMRPAIMFRLCTHMCNHEGYTTSTITERRRSLRSGGPLVESWRRPRTRNYYSRGL